MVMKILILIFFEIKESKITRGHNFTLVKKLSRLDVKKFSFSQRTINVWNKLSAECVHDSSVNMFKNRIDKYNNNGRNGSFLRGWLPHRGKGQMACNHCFPTRTMF